MNANFICKMFYKEREPKEKIGKWLHIVNRNLSKFQNLWFAFQFMKMNYHVP